MLETKQQSADGSEKVALGSALRFELNRLRHSLSAKLIVMLIAAMTVTFALLGYLNVRLHRGHLEATTLTAAERVSDTLRRTSVPLVPAYAIFQKSRLLALGDRCAGHYHRDTNWYLGCRRCRRRHDMEYHFTYIQLSHQRFVLYRLYGWGIWFG